MSSVGVVNTLRKHSKTFYNSLIRSGLSPEKSRELTAEHVDLMRYLMKQGMSMKKAHESATLLAKWAHYQPDTRRRLVLSRVRGPKKLSELLAD